MEENEKMMVGGMPIEEISDAFEKINEAIETLEGNIDKELIEHGRPAKETMATVAIIGLIASKTQFKTHSLLKKAGAIADAVMKKDQKSETPALPVTRNGVAS